MFAPYIVGSGSLRKCTCSGIMYNLSSPQAVPRNESNPQPLRYNDWSHSRRRFGQYGVDNSQWTRTQHSIWNLSESEPSLDNFITGNRLVSSCIQINFHSWSFVAEAIILSYFIFPYWRDCIQKAVFIRRLMRPAISTQGFLAFSFSSNKCWDSVQIPSY